MRSLAFFSFFFLSVSAYSQSNVFKNASLSLHYQHGFALPEYTFLSYLVQEPIQSLTVDFSKKTVGRNDWERLYKFPEYGLSFFYTNLGNDAVLGQAFALNYFFKVNFIDREKWKVFNQTGIGLGYLTRKFDLVENYKNVGIGSHVNIHFNFRVGSSYQIGSRLAAQLGLAFDHFSNGNTQDPNLGLNNVTVFAGLRHTLGMQDERNTQSLSKHQRSNNFELVGNVGGKKTRSISSDYFLTASLTGGINRAFFRGVNLGLGVDLFYDESIRTQREARGESFHPSNSWQTGVHLSQEFRYNRFSLILQEGIYLGLTNKGNNKIMYNRGIIQFQLKEHILLRLAMKSHLHILDFPELGIGIKW